MTKRSSTIMNSYTGWTQSHGGSDPDFQAEVGPPKTTDEPLPGVVLRRRQFRLRTLMLVIALAAVGMGLLLDPNIAPLTWLFLGAFGIALAVMALAMGLGLLGFGLCTVGDRFLGWLRRSARWPDS